MNEFDAGSASGSGAGGAREPGAGGLWEAGAAGVLLLPSGRTVRGRGLRRPLPPGPSPSYAVHLLGRRPPEVPWESRWLRWPDFWLPSNLAEAREVFTDAWERAAGERVELACAGGRGRTGTALACLAVLDGVPADRAVEFVRGNYDAHAVETPWQKRYVRQFSG
ncbi:protein-tyrosine phosphatase family protein [Streptomyces sp. NPDC004685]